MKKFKFTCVKISFLSLALMMSQAHALVIPKADTKDARVQRVTYDPNNVISIKAKIGRAVLIQLEDDERLEGDSAALGMGDSEAWNLSVKGNNILFKPKMENPDTNLIVTTNKRTYIFQLSIVEDDQEQPTYVLRFYYPDTVAKNEQAQKSKQRKAYETFTSFNRQEVNIQNEEYYGYGNKSIAPTAMYDDGRFTYLEFSHNGELPTVYKQTPDGTESLVNTRIQGDAIVIHELAEHFILRHGKAVLGVKNQAFNKGQFNHRGTSVDNAVRIVKDHDE